MERLNSVRVAGDLDGDGLGDLLLNLTPVGADGLEVSPGRSLVWVRGDASLADARLRTIEFALPESGVGASRTGDLDGDGYADLRVSRRMPGSFPFAPAELRVLFGAPDGPVHPSPEIDLNQGHFHREYTNSGDFNGDGATDLAAYEGMDPQSDITGGFALAMSFAGPGRSVTPVGWTSQCAAAAAAIGPLDVFGAGFAVLDADGDGFDDLRLHLAYSHGTVTWYGCPNFFASGRCTFEP